MIALALLGSAPALADSLMPASEYAYKQLADPRQEAQAVDLMDKAGNKAAQAEIAMIKVQAPNMALRIIDDAVQAHGGAGVSQDFALASSWAGIRTLRLADGPDEVHNRAIARIEFAKHAPAS